MDNFESTSQSELTSTLNTPTVEMETAVQTQKPDFNTALKKYNKNIANKEEVDFVEQTVRDARAIGKTRLRGDKHIGFGKRIKRFFTKILVMCLIILVALGYGFITVRGYAQDNIMIGKSTASNRAVEFLVNDLQINPSQVNVINQKTKLIISIPFERSYYLYEYTMSTSNGANYYIWLDSYSGLTDYYNK